MPLLTADMNLHLLFFGAPQAKYGPTLSRLKKQAEEVGIFKSINMFTEDNVFQACPALEEYRGLMESSRGYGYWIWKYHLISKLLQEINEGEVLLYLDAGCSLNPSGLERMRFYYDQVLQTGGLAFKGRTANSFEHRVTKQDTYTRIIGDDNTHYGTPQVQTTVMFFRSDRENLSFMNEIMKIFREDDQHHFDDSPSVLPNGPNFRGHRHDQSVFSLLCKKRNFFVIRNETYFRSDWEGKGKLYPLWATRNRPK